MPASPDELIAEYKDLLRVHQGEAYAAACSVTFGRGFFWVGVPRRTYNPPGWRTGVLPNRLCRRDFEINVNYLREKVSRGELGGNHPDTLEAQRALAPSPTVTSGSNP